MAQTTENFGFYLEDSGETKFKDWRDKINGPNDSNTVKMDNALHELDISKQSKLTGLPHQVLRFDGMGLPYAAEGWSNRNLIINWDFRRPINRNGRAEYAGAGIGIDGWLSNNTALVVTVNGDGTITIHNTGTSIGYYRQTLRKPLDPMDLTLSVLVEASDPNSEHNGMYFCYDDNTFSTVTRLDAPGLYSQFGSASNGKKVFRVQINVAGGGSLTLRAAKLELGDHQTLARQNEDGEWEIIDPPDYDLQYALCSLYSPSTGGWVGYQHSNENLLHNWYFPDPINQRKKTEYTAEGYIIDRWKSSTQSTYNLTDSGLQCGLNANLAQLLEDESLVSGEVYTLSVLDSGNNLYTVSGILSRNLNNNWQISKSNVEGAFIGVRSMSSGLWDVRLRNNSGWTLIAAKLELGPVQTLAHQDADGNWVLNDPPPDKALELAKCQRYQVAFMHNICRMSTYNNNQLAFIVNLPVNMRSTPTIAIDGFAVKSIIDGNVVPGFSFEALRYNNGIVQISASKTGHGMQDGILSANTLTLLDANL